MGSAVSSISTRVRDTENVTSESETMNTDSGHDTDSNVVVEEQFYDAASEDVAREKAKEEEMNKFRKQLDIKREQRREILNRHRTEKEQLEKSLQKEITSKLKLHGQNNLLRELLQANNIEIPETLENASGNSEVTDAINKLREELEKMKFNNNKLRRDLVESNSALQEAYSDIADLHGQNTESMKQINALKEVVSVSKTMINLREGQLNELKNKLNEIEKSLSDREANMLSADLRQEYMRQLQNIRTLRGLYEERARLAEVTRQGLLRELEEQKALYQSELTKSKSLMAKVDDLEEKVETLQDTVDDKNIEISTSKDETNKMKAEMAVVNKLFSQVLLGYKTKQDLDKLVHRLEENHGILTHMAEKENDSEASSALPKLLLELVSQMDENESAEKVQNVTIKDEDVTENSDAVPSTTPEEIVENLPKVWRVLMELLSHQTVAEDPEEKVTTCYKLVETKSGPVEVPSVSQTYIRLKDLIVEKLGLVKEVNRMKQLNCHLETRLQEQEKRLCLVTTELSKTWHVVGKLRRHHFQLHTHEKILKYELQQKRKLINEIKEELEYCREKWEQAREKNSQSEKDWRKLRAEFSSRKTGSPSFNNSGESGYSDERPSDESSESNDESEYVAEPPTRSKKKNKKSFETIFDSSNDFNLAAEREDPVSDMLDVADLPLDTHDTNDNNGSSTECTKSENVLKCETNLETEDEVCDINHDDSCIEDHITEHQILDTDNVECIESSRSLTLHAKASTSSSLDAQLIDPATILSNIKKQNEMLAKKDVKLESLEKDSASLLKKTQATSKLSQEIDSTLDHIINRPSSSTQFYLNSATESLPSSSWDTCTTKYENIEISDDTKDLLSVDETNESTSKSDSDTEQEVCTGIANSDSNPLSVDFKAILENVKRQNERLAKKDERLNNLEKECSEVVQNISNTLNSGQEMIEKIDVLHSGQNPPNASSQTDDATVIDNNTLSENNLSEPSTSNDNNHEARFAARDLRLKRLEEQTKSLVKKVNKTKSKGVKINYKLEELHNIYGSENSRAGTPSEEIEERSTEEDDSTKE